MAAAPAVRPAPAYLPALTGIRFFLALWVIVHHLTGRRMLLDAWVRSLPEDFQQIVYGGYLAVGTFFVLSGFVLAQGYYHASWNRTSLIRYCAARWARVYPVYFLSLLVLSPIILADLHVPQRTGAELEQKAALLANYSLVLQGWTGHLPVQWNTPAWSLSCEMFFYLCFPAAVVLLRNRPLAQIGLIGALTFVLPNLLREAGVPDHTKPLLHMADFLAGIAAARFYMAAVQTKHWLVGRGYWLYLPAFAGALLLITNPAWLPPSVSLNTSMRPFNVLLLTGLSLGGGLPVRALSAGFVNFLGRSSYSMYILHIPVLWWYKRYLAMLWAPHVSAFIYITGVIAISGVVCERIEEPACRKVRAWVARRFDQAG